MQIVNPGTECTLLVEENSYLAKYTITAKAALYHMLKGHGHGLDAAGMPFHFKDMKSKVLSLYSNQPVMRSAPNFLTGEETCWIIPTVFVPNWSFWYKGKKKWSEDNLPPLSEVFQHYRGICQKCLGKIKNLSEASRDHNKPKSIGGENNYINITLMHRKCNSELGNSYPKTNVLGEPIVPKMKVFANHWYPKPGQKLWPGWQQHAPWVETFDIIGNER